MKVYVLYKNTLIVLIYYIYEHINFPVLVLCKSQMLNCNFVLSFVMCAIRKSNFSVWKIVEITRY